MKPVGKNVEGREIRDKMVHYSCLQIFISIFSPIWMEKKLWTKEKMIIYSMLFSPFIFSSFYQMMENENLVHSHLFLMKSISYLFFSLLGLKLFLYVKLLIIPKVFFFNGKTAFIQLKLEDNKVIVQECKKPKTLGFF